MHKQTVGRWICLLCLILALACNFPTPTPEASPEATQIADAPTAEAPPPGEISPPAETPTPGPTPTEAPPVEGEGGCTLRAAYVADVTIPDNTVLDKGAEFVKTWRLRNSGTCPWEEGTRLVYVSGEALGAPVAVNVPATAPNAMVDISVTMRAPTQPGTYKSNWQLESPTGQRYGGIFYAQIVIAGEPTATPTVTPTSAPTGNALPTNLTSQVSADCTKVTLTWVDGQGESKYRLEGAGFSVILEANTTSYVWQNPPAGNSVVALIALNAAGAEIGRVTATVGVHCAVSGAVDLVLQSITFNPTTPVAYMPLKVTVEVKNVGDVASGPFVVQWWGGKNFSAVSCEWNVTEGLAGGATKQLTCETFTFNSPYAALVTKAQADAANAVTESNKTNNLLERPIDVVRPVTVYNFIEEAPSAVWQAGDPLNDNLGWNGAKGNTAGFARWDNGPLENNIALQDKCLETHPMWVNNGWIAGYYVGLYHNNYTIQAGDTIYAKVGLLNGANAGNVTFKVMVRTASSGNRWIGEVAHTYGTGIKTLTADLTPYAGQRADIVLQVNAGASSEQDWACWTQAVLYRYP